MSRVENEQERIFRVTTARRELRTLQAAGRQNSEAFRRALAACNPAPQTWRTS